MFDTLLLCLLLLFAGAGVGSFANVVADRLPKGEDIIFSRSRCSKCGHVLKWYDMIPLVSYPLLGGRCRYCGARIPLRLWLGEIWYGLLLMGLTCVYYPRLDLILFYFAFYGLLTVMSITDYKYQTVDNKLVYTALLLIGVFLLYEYLSGYMTLSMLQVRVVTAFVIFVLFSVVFYLFPGSIGGADVKFLPLVSLIFPFPIITTWFLITFGLALFAGVLLILYNKQQNKKQKIKLAMFPFFLVGSLITHFLILFTALFYK